jgi:hypothetical protein
MPSEAEAIIHRGMHVRVQNIPASAAIVSA